jgi:hypothetical protein
VASPGSEASFWDFEQTEPRITQVDHSDDTDEESSGESSGYECMVVPYIYICSTTNFVCQLTWVIPLTKKISEPKSYHKRLRKKSQSCPAPLQHRVPGRLHLSHFSEAPGR